jgi:hypothetical protein
MLDRLRKWTLGRISSPTGDICSPMEAWISAFLMVASAL